MNDIRSEIEAVYTEMTAEPPQGSTEETPTETPVEQAAPATQETETAVEPQATTPASGTPPPSSTPAAKRGPIPLDRHEEVLRNTRAEYDGKLAKLSWAEKYQNPEEIEQQLGMIRLLDENPVEFFRRFHGAAQSDTNLMSQLQQFFVPKPATQPAEDKKPEPDRLLDTGDLVYSAQQQEKLLEWYGRQVERRIEQRYGKTITQVEADAEWNKELSKQRRVLDDARTNWEGFKDNEKEIATLMADGRVTLESAYRRVVIPKLKANESEIEKRVRASVIAELNNKGSVVTEKPGAAVPSTPKSYAGMSAEDILRETYNELAGRA